MAVKQFRKEEEVYLKGKIKWCKHLRPDAKYDKYSVVMYIEGAELEKAREWQAMGIRNAVRKDDDGWFITLSRKTSIETRGKSIPLEPPKVIDKDGNSITEMVGNGSDGIAKCILWKYSNKELGFSGTALRWEALRVDNFIKYSPENDYPDGGESLNDLKKEEALF